MRKKVPDKIRFTELFASFLYSLLTWVSVIVLFIGVVAILYYYSCFIVERDFTNPEFFQASVYLVIGAFLVLFVHNEKCKNRILKKGSRGK